jgi:alpha-glucosidase
MGNDVAARNVAVQQADPRSLLSLYRRVIELRRHEPALTEGEYMPVRSRNDILAFRRRLREEEILVFLNTAPDPRSWDGLPPVRLLLSTSGDRRDGPPDTTMLLQGDEGLVLKVAR